jgi:hypothetical protein
VLIVWTVRSTYVISFFSVVVQVGNGMRGSTTSGRTGTTPTTEDFPECICRNRGKHGMARCESAFSFALMGGPMYRTNARDGDESVDSLLL